jgi:hypothetical protein
MFGASRTRQEVLAALAPFVADTRSRLGGISDSAWSHPRTLGFLMSLVTLLAAVGGRAHGSAMLGLVQSQVWSRLSGRADAGVGDRVAVLAATRDAAFSDGCRRAFDFIRQLDPEAVRVHMPGDASELGDLWGPEIALLGAILISRLQCEDLRTLELWAEAFDPLAFVESPGN